MDKRFKILAVDDEYVNIQLLKSVLCDEYDIITALNGHEAIDLIEQYKPDLILLDVVMPDITGFEVCKIIKADERFADIPVIFLTALDTQEGELEGLELGGIDYITKPINFALLKLRVRNHLSMKEQRDLLVSQKAELDQMLTEQRLQNERMRETKSQLRENKQKLADIIEFLPDATLAIDNEKRVIIWNRAIEEMTGVPASEMIGKDEYAYTVPFYGEARPQLMDLVYLDRTEIVARYPNIARSGDTLIAEVFCPALYNNKGAWVYAKASPLHDQDGNIIGVIESIRDISEQRLVEQYREMSSEVLQILNKPTDLKESVQSVIAELKMRTGFDAVGIRLQERDDYPYFVQEGFSKDFLLKENTLIGRTVDGGICRDKDGKVCLECTCGLVISGKFDTSHPFFTKGGSFWTNDSYPLLDIPITSDSRNNPRNECIHHGYASVALIPIKDMDRIIGLLHFNDHRQDCFTLETVELLEGIATHIGAALMRKIAEDEKSLLEQQFQHAQKLESLGVLAGGVAHDFNNILAIIMGYCSLIRMDYEDASAHIPLIEKAAERAAGLCRQMLAYAGKAQLANSQVNIWMLVDEIVSMLKSTISKNVTIAPELPFDIPFIMGDESQLRQVAMNLIINASEAIGDEQGTIRVSLTKSEVKASQFEADHLGKTIPLGSYVCLEVADTGCGMDDETVRKIFEPFFTTKFTGRGLGMSALLGIITAHKGALQVFSQLGQGTTFKVYLPIQFSTSTEEKTQTKASEESWRGSGTILLVDDEEQVLAIAKAILKRFGFTVIEATNGKEALELYLKNVAEIKLVLTDMGMPIMDGYALFRELKKLNPGLPIIISSGFGYAEITSKIPRDEIAGLVSKPYSFDQLQDVLKSVTASGKI